MAGNYMDAPNDRIAWDRDGSVLTTITIGGIVNTQSASVRRVINAEGSVGASMGNTLRVAVVFPAPMDCTAVFFSYSTSALWTVETSKDTTNGLDGAWDTQYLTDLNAFKDVTPNYRLASQLYTLQDNSSSSDLRGIRLSSTTTQNSNIRALHIYGTPSSIATKDRLAFWHPTSDVRLSPAYFDWGNVPRSSSADKSFRIKNLSTNLYAGDIDVYVESLTAVIPGVDNMHTLSADGGVTFLTGQTLVGLNPGASSEVLTVRRTIPADAQVSVWSARIAADVNNWGTA